MTRNSSQLELLQPRRDKSVTHPKLIHQVISPLQELLSPEEALLSMLSRMKRPGNHYWMKLFADLAFISAAGTMKEVNRAIADYNGKLGMSRPKPVSRGFDNTWATKGHPHLWKVLGCQNPFLERLQFNGRDQENIEENLYRP